MEIDRQVDRMNNYVQMTIKILEEKELKLYLPNAGYIFLDA